MIALCQLPPDVGPHLLEHFSALADHHAFLALAFDEDLDGEDGEDLDIDEELSLEEFLAAGEDLNDDGAIDELDYEEYLALLEEYSES